MDIKQFWQIIADSREGLDADHPDGNMDNQVQNLSELLISLDRDEVIAFDYYFSQQMFAAYRRDLWNAAYLINGGCSDDGFTDFRSWLISMGREVYEQAIANPDSLALLLDDPAIEDFFFEEFAYVVYGIYPDDLEHNLVHPQKPQGADWPISDEIFQKHLPLLWEKCC
jgi:hypothetical protein